MYSHILIATDGSVFAQKGLDHGLSLARSLGAKVTVITATEGLSRSEMVGELRRHPNRNPIDELESHLAEAAAKILQKAAASAQAVGIAAETVYVKDQYPAPAILQTAEERDCDLIVMASHGRRGLARLVLGSQAAEVVAGSKIPVLVVR